MVRWLPKSVWRYGCMIDLFQERRDFSQLIAIVAEQRGIDLVLVEKDYWIMHACGAYKCRDSVLN